MKESYQPNHELRATISTPELTEDIYAAQYLEGRDRQEQYRRINTTIRNALASAAERLCGGFASEYSAFTTTAQAAYDSYNIHKDDKEDHPVERLHTGLYALLPDYIDTLPALTHSQYASKEQWQEARNNAVRLNHLVREAIDYHPDLTSHDLTRLAKQVTTFHLHHRGYNREQIAHQWNGIDKQLQTTINGIRHEVAFEEMIYKARDTYDCRPGTDEEDIRGIDYVVTRKRDGKELYIDVKASELAVQQSSHKRARHEPDPQRLTLTTGLMPDDFPNGSMQAPIKKIQQYAVSLQQKIDAGFMKLDQPTHASQPHGKSHVLDSSKPHRQYKHPRKRYRRYATSSRTT